jgi:hypothetical protein
MEPATIAVLVITGAFIALCAWIEWHSRRRSAGAARVEPMEVALAVTESETLPKNLRRKRSLRS